MVEERFMSPVFRKKKKTSPAPGQGADTTAGRTSPHIGRDPYRETSPLVKSKPALLQGLGQEMLLHFFMKQNFANL